MTRFTTPSSPRLLALLLLFSLSLIGCAIPPADAPAAPPQPELATGSNTKPGWTLRRQAVAAANPLAAEAGAAILRAGGSAVDAAVAVQMVLTLVEPQSSGIGGGAFLLHHDGRQVQAFDGRETAPAEAGGQLFMGADGKPMGFMEAVVGGRSVGVPGTVAMLSLAHRQHGKLPWAKLFEPAIALAENGFEVSPRLFGLLKAETALQTDPVATAYFFQPDGQPHPVGHRLKNPELAAVLRSIAIDGPNAFYRGAVAQAMVNKARQHPTNPGGLALGDLERYRPVERNALCHAYTPPDAKGKAPAKEWSLCGFPPPSSGALAIGQILGVLARTPGGAEPLGADGLPTPGYLHAYTEASRLAFADRALYLGDPDFVAPPAGRWTSLLDARYLDERAQLIGPAHMPQAPAGAPQGTVSAWAPMPEQPEYGTSHISIVDAFGNALAMTTTIESGFGSRLMVSTDPSRPGGFLLNNELTDFSFSPTDAQGRPVANRVEPGKRPRSSMAPTLVFDKASGQLLMSTGSPGGAFIIHYTAKTLLGVLQWGLTPQAAIDLPNFGSLGGPLVLEAERFPQATADALRERGHKVNGTALTSGLQAIVRGEVRGQPAWLGGADPRREGVVAGE
ncbi:gamma-glutamyltransferase [Hydrogenophaga crassostreae]|uniref:Gamma-glutamyltransferase n=1 Tax=Hydrogenophaga crassostreae TaxID=1763535 RepID=A0A167I597_9BURK|nr:gamma-glutamyltransferase family protein [Hydrogenophaga crassostreae]AOW14111.1 gamma-glutamyltransferase [Hydrogenophaga crassostreae]OAD42167.1 gamma-glutamyltransferase [Hydrogenophaga crassostreae]